MKYEIGQKVRVALSGAGVTTYETFTVLDINDEGDVFLNDGSGWDDPLGPFDAKTGVRTSYMMPGWEQRIVDAD